jgi:acyl carrier protein
VRTAEFLDAICEAIGRPVGSLALDDTPSTVAEWDSVGHLGIIATIDASFGIPTDSEDLQRFASLRQLVDALRSRGVVLED